MIWPPDNIMESTDSADAGIDPVDPLDDPTPTLQSQENSMAATSMPTPLRDFLASPSLVGPAPPLLHREAASSSGFDSRSSGTFNIGSASSTSLPPRSSSYSPPVQQKNTSSSVLPLIHSPSDAGTPFTTFEPPLRSIFSSGLPTASVSSSTAQASMSSSTPSNRPLAALSGAHQSRRPLLRAIDISLPEPSARNDPRNLLSTEKDVDDPTTSIFSQTQDVYQLSNSESLSKLFATTDRLTPGLSRVGSHMRSFSATQRALTDVTTLTGHLFQNGFIDGRHHDIIVRAFGQEYKLHKLILDRIPFFSSAFSGAWAESSAREMTLHADETDVNITRAAFELALRRAYGGSSSPQEEQEAIGLFATACWLDMSELVDTSIDSLLRQMHPARLHTLIKLVTTNYYGKAGDRILSSAKAMLCREGWEMPYQYWDNIPAEIIREVIGGDPFFIPDEWERWYLALKLVNRRLRAQAVEAGLVSSHGVFLHPKPTSLKFFAIRFDTTYKHEAGLTGAKSVDDKDHAWVSLYTSPEVAPLLVLLDEGIHYMHLGFEKLQQIRNQRDILGVPVLPEKVISNALWMSMELRQRVLNSHENDLELGLSEEAEEYEDTNPDPPVNTTVEKGKGREGAQEETTEMESDSWDGNGKPRKFWIPTNDISCVMGGGRDVRLSADWNTHSHRLSSSLEPSDVIWASDFTGSAADISNSLARNNLSSQAIPRFSHYPPFRFSAEFPHPRTLKEKKRVYSQTVFYAGSLWNLYIQRVNTSKSQQLGIYLHRAKDKDPSDDPLAQFIPSASVDDRIGQLEREMLMRKTERRSHPQHRSWRAGDRDDDDDEADFMAGNEPSFHQSTTHGTQPINRQRSATPTRNPTTGTLFNSLLLPDTDISSPETPHFSFFPPTSTGTTNPTIPSTTNSTLTSFPPQPQQSTPQRQHLPHRPTISTIPPYTDARPTIKTYFKIYSPSKAGRMLSIYESAPDRFNFSQSWGWKSSGLVLDDGLGDGFVGVGGGADMGRGTEDCRGVGGGLSGGNGLNGGAGGTGTGAGSGNGNGSGGLSTNAGSNNLPPVSLSGPISSSNTSTRGDGKLRYMVVIGNV